MADTKISALTALAGSGVAVADDVLPIVDTSVTTTKKIAVNELATAMGATQAQQETGTSTAALVSPGVQHYHLSAAKGWVQFQPDGTVDTSYNVTSITDSGTGDWTITWATDFSSANHCDIAIANRLDGGCIIATLAGALAAGTTNLHTFTDAAVAADGNRLFVVAFGDHS